MPLATPHFYSPDVPELPEVEGYRRYFEEHALSRRVEHADTHDARILDGITPPLLRRRVEGERFVSTLRRGKHLFCGLSNGRYVHLHFGMTGDLVYSPEGTRSRFARVSFLFDDGSRLSFDDARLFGWVGVVDSVEEEIARRELGPDPLTISARNFAQLFERRRGAIKSMLMNQSNIAGLGNLYVDETLYMCGIRPTRRVEELSAEDISHLYCSMKKILTTTLKHHSANRPLPAKWLIGRRDLDLPCAMCGGRIRRATLFGRTTYFCKDHQK